MVSQKVAKIQKNVIPAKAGIQEFNKLENPWTPVFTGVTTFCETIF
jgi:hypothetical protein